MTTRIRSYPAIMALSLLFWAPPAALTQDATAQPAAQAPMPIPTPSPIPATDIPSRAERAGSLVRTVSASSQPNTAVAGIEVELPSREKSISNLRAETESLLHGDASSTLLEDIEKRWLREQYQLDAWLDTLSARARALDAELARLQAEAELWRLTRSTAREQNLPDALNETVRSTLRSISEGEREVGERRDTVLTLQTRASELKATTGEMLGAIQRRLAERRRGLLSLDAPPLWRVIAEPKIERSLLDRFLETPRINFRAVSSYVRDEQARLAVQIGILISIVVTLYMLRRRAEQWAGEDESLADTVAVLGRPVAAGLLLSCLVDPWIHSTAPAAWRHLVMVVLLIAMLRLLPRLMPRQLRPGLPVLVVLYVLDRLLLWIPEDNLIHRLALLTLSTAIGAALVWLARRLIRQGQSGQPRTIIAAARVGAALTGIAVVANIVGGLSLATMLTTGTLISTLAAIILWLGARVTRGATAVWLRTPTAQRLNMVRLRETTIRRTAQRAIRILAVFGWLYFSLKGFGLVPWVSSTISAVTSATLTVGDWQVVPFDLLLFGLAAWLSFRISKLIRFVLDEDVLPRVELPRGVPGAVSKGVHYVVLLVGFLIAAAIAGFDVGRFTLIAGALGVGIGFGLQTVVNNFVSGLILLFERPIQVGDKIQVGEVFGEVREIGMRASVVRTWQGAEVIVPNANLISNELINWTLSDRRRRLDIPVGVAYGTDPEQVIELLQTVAKKHPEILSDPEPNALFLGFGDSSLDFELRAWTPVFEGSLRVKSELSVALNRALADAEIEIPFPQRDLHLRSVDAEAGATLKESR